MNEGRGNDPFTYAALSNEMGLHSVGALENVALGNVDPPFGFLDSFCNTFGVTRQWLVEGKGTPYAIFDPGRSYSDPYTCLDVIRATRPKMTYFVRSASAAGETTLVLKYSEYRYKVIRHHWNISDQVGGQGEQQILGMYRLLKALSERRAETGCSGGTLSNDIFWKLYGGTIFAGSVINLRFVNQWWDDFTDITHHYDIAKHYEGWYGKGFVRAQEIARVALLHS